MLPFLWIITGMTIVGGAAVIYMRSRDPLHPAVILMPPFLYFYSVWPLLLNRNGNLLNFLPEEVYAHAATVFLCSIAALYIGLMSGTSRAASQQTGIVNVFFEKISRSPRLQRNLYSLAIVIGGISLLAFASAFDFSLSALIDGYSRGKGGGGRLASGYIGEAMILSLPAVIVLALAVRARGKLLPQDIIVALILISPQLLQGTLGGRRGPLFMSLTVLFFGWFIARGRSPSVPQAVLGVSLAGLLLIAVAANRQEVYLGSGEAFDLQSGVGQAFSDDIGAGNEYVGGAAYVETYRLSQEYFWGYRYFVTFVVRPIPRQIWPTKYQDMNAYWLDQLGSENYNSAIYTAVGFALPRGASTGSIADGYGEFSWGVVLMFFGLGRAFAAVWNRHKLRGGYWTVLLFLMLALSVYLPTQSFSAWMVRVMYAGISSLVVWRFFFRESDFSPARRPSAPAVTR